MSSMDPSDRWRMLAVDAARPTMAGLNRDKRTRVGRRRHVRRVGDHNLLLATCGCSGTIARGCAKPGEVCSFCGGAVLTSGEKTGAVPPG